MRDAVSGRGGDEEGLGEGDQRVQAFGVEKELALVRQIDLVEDEELAFGAVLQRFGDIGDLGAEPALGIHHQRDDVRAFGPAPRRLHHRAVEAAGGGEDAGGVDQHDLRIAFDGDAEQARAGGCALGLTIATFWPTRALTSVDLPALGAPTTATRPQRVCVS